MATDRTRMIAFIPLRGGSKGIIGKNIKPIAGRPLVYWVLDAATGCPLIDEVVISTDDDNIAAVVQAYGDPNIRIFFRSPETATSTASTESAMIEYARKHELTDIVLIQATSPLLESQHLTDGISLYWANGFDSVLSAVRQKRFYWDCKEDGLAVPLNYEPSNRPLRQQMEGRLVENGAFYICSKKALLTTGSRLSGRIGVLEMPEDSYHELDEEIDWIYIEQLLMKKSRGTADEIAPTMGDKLKGIKLFLSDVDGVLTDAGMYYGEQGDELKKFNTRDGKAFELLKKAGLKVGIVTSENTKIVERRARKLNVDFLYQGAKDKSKILDEIVQASGVDPHEVAFIGDDINDASILERVGFSATPADGMDSIKKMVDYICTRKGGEGCVREIAERILSAKNEVESYQLV